MRGFFSLFKISLSDKPSRRLFIGALFSVSFSVSVILSTMALMDGFENSLRSSLLRSDGDISLFNKDSFFYKDVAIEKLDPTLMWTPLVEVEAFLVFEEKTKGVLVKGIDQENFFSVSGLKISPSSNEVVIGSELSKTLSLNVGDDFVVAVSSLKNDGLTSPILLSLSVKDIVTHGIYEKDLRFLYLDISFLQEALGIRSSTINKVLIKTNEVDFKVVDQLALKLDKEFPPSFRVQSSWREYSSLFNAVEVEKASIVIILQLIVVVSIFNIVAFILFINEKKVGEFFLLRAIGLSFKSLRSFWLLMVGVMWIMSMTLGFIFTKIFNFLLTNIDLLKIPGEIYVLSSLKLELNFLDFLYVSVITLVWILLICVVGIHKLKKQEILHGLREEFR